MCLLVFKSQKSKKFISYEAFQNASQNNPDGIGIAYADNGKLIIRKYVSDKVQEAYMHYLTIPKQRNILIHFRLSTGGKTDLRNTHPYVITKNLCVAHNGIMQHIKPTTKSSDTRQFALFLRQIKNIDLLIFNKKFNESLQSYIDEKLVFLHSSGKGLIFNENRFHNIKGIYYSNYSYEYSYTKKVYEYHYPKHYDDYYDYLDYTDNKKDKKDFDYETVHYWSIKDKKRFQIRLKRSEIKKFFENNKDKIELYQNGIN